MEDVVRESNTSGHISDSELSKALEGLKKDYPNGIEGCGADALRFGLCFYDVTSTHMNLDLNVIKTAGAFGNKIWQASRFLVMAHAVMVLHLIEPLCQSSSESCFFLQRVQSPVSSVVPPASSLLPHDKWILSRCAATVAEMHGHLEKREFPLMARCLRRFLYTNLCDVYLVSLLSLWS
jgi:valyl-tRNA synthetase